METSNNSERSLPVLGSTSSGSRGSVAPLSPSAEFPLANRLDLPEHERSVSARVLAELREGVEQARQMIAEGREFKRFDLSALCGDEDEDDQ